ncbi:hypothetical protein OG21DRAFT_1486100 [Imleria badia]|nr:hypothetical protein OG21DRAFT_1486100 [Imleria badia]
MDFGLKGVHVLVTGASGGIGLETAKLYCSLGAKVTQAAHYNTHYGPLRSLSKAHANLQTVQAELSDETSVKNMFTAIAHAGPRREPWGLAFGGGPGGRLDPSTMEPYHRDQPHLVVLDRESMPDDGEPPTTTAQSPFDDLNADIVLHTSDHVDFHVFRFILTLSSPFFQSMFTLPQPPDESVHDKSGTADAQDDNHSTNWNSLSDQAALNPPSVDVPESSQTLDTLLRIIYPNTPVPSFRGLRHARHVALAACKYDMFAALETIADRLQMQYAATRPLDVYFIACRMGWEGVAKAAAAYCLDPKTAPGGAKAISEKDLMRPGGLLNFPGAAVAYHRLEAYRNACRTAVEDSLDSVITPKVEECGFDNEGGGGAISSNCLSRWLVEYYANIRLAVTKCPRKETMDDRYLVPRTSCNCNIGVVNEIATAQLEVASEIDEVLSNVR